MTTGQSQRYTLGGVVNDRCVVDTHTGKVVFGGPLEACRAYIREHNEGHLNEFAMWQSLSELLIKAHVMQHPTPWSAQFPGVGVDVVAQDGTHIVSADDVHIAAKIIELAQALELELFPDGRPSS
jgi:hypothetical protein